MAKYTCKRLLQSLLTVLIVVTIVFLLLRLLPTDYYFTEEQLNKLTEAQKLEILQAAGLTDPIWKQLLSFYNDILHFDFGTSRRISSGIAVVDLIGSKFGLSMRLGCVALIFSLCLGVPVGLFQAYFKGKVFDGIGTAYTIFMNAVPSIVSYSLVMVFGARVLKLPTLYSVTKPVISAVMPVFCMSMGATAGYMLWTRRYVVDELNKDYIKLAKMTGMSQKTILIRHVLKNAFVPMAQYLPASFLSTVSGSLLAEKFFSVPGMGPLLADAIGRYDTPVVQTLVIIYASMGVLGVFLGDVLMTLIDPRIRITGKGDVG
ncbi:MAG: ABC transporter permease [Clostridiales bacterium]|nr:ABC transporter permease [Clostridiales bacterium]